MRSVVILAAFAAALAACSNPAEQEAAKEETKPAPRPFNLHCVGMKRNYMSAAPLTDLLPPQSFDDTFRIDLAARSWCSGSCEAIHKIAHFDDREISLFLDTQQNSLRTITLNRLTGEFRDNDMIGTRDGATASTTLTSAKCDVQPFSGFPPPPKPKF